MVAPNSMSLWRIAPFSACWALVIAIGVDPSVGDEPLEASRADAGVLVAAIPPDGPPQRGAPVALEPSGSGSGEEDAGANSGSADSDQSTIRRPAVRVECWSGARTPAAGERQLRVQLSDIT